MDSNLKFIHILASYAQLKGANRISMLSSLEAKLPRALRELLQEVPSLRVTFPEILLQVSSPTCHSTCPLPVEYYSPRGQAVSTSQVPVGQHKTIEPQEHAKKDRILSQNYIEKCP